jgi:hypothetical protein
LPQAYFFPFSPPRLSLHLSQASFFFPAPFHLPFPAGSFTPFLPPPPARKKV